MNIATNAANIIAEIVMNGIFHAPDTTIANAKNPSPATLPSKKLVCGYILAPPYKKTAPAVLANNPEINTPIHLYLFTFKPCESTAFGLSPTALNLKPNLVLLIINIAIPIINKATANIKIVSPKKKLDSPSAPWILHVGGNWVISF